MVRLVEMIYTEEDMQGLREEIKKLKSDLSLVIKERDDNIEQNKKLSEKIGQLEEQIENLKSDWER